MHRSQSLPVPATPPDYRLEKSHHYYYYDEEEEEEMKRLERRLRRLRRKRRAMEEKDEVNAISSDGGEVSYNMQECSSSRYGGSAANRKQEVSPAAQHL